MIAPFMLALLAVQAQETPPSITYGSPRQSEKWIDIGGTSVAVDKGITWDGVTVYLSLTSELVAVDEKSGKALWAAHVGGYWSRITFERRDVRCEPARWIVVLANEPGSRDGDLKQYHEVRTGRVIAGPDQAPAGEPLALAARWSGAASNLATPLRVLVETEADWKSKVLQPMFDGRADAPAFGTIDFSKSRVLVVSLGDTTNCLGIHTQAWASEFRILARLTYSCVQSGPEGIPGRPFGIIVLPKTPAPVVVEHNVQHYIGGPPIWKELCRFEPVLK